MRHACEGHLVQPEILTGNKDSTGSEKVMDIQSDIRFKGIEACKNKVWLSSPTMHGEELQYMKEAYETNWMSTVGENINEIERMASSYIGIPYAVALSSGTAALHLAVRLAAERLYGRQAANTGMLAGRRVFCSDMTFGATVNPVAYEGGEAVFIDTEQDTWNMDPQGLERAFRQYPDTRLVIAAHLYGTPGKIEEIRAVCDTHKALLIEDAAESLGASYKGRQTGTFGDYSIISFNGNKIITGSSGGMLLTRDEPSARKARKWSTQSREAAPWYQHEELGYNYRMSNVVAGVVRGQWGHLKEHIQRKREIYERYREGLKGLPVTMNPFDGENSTPNFWLSCMLIDCDAMCECVRSEESALYVHKPGKSCPDEILEALSHFNMEGRPVWKPMHMQPVYRNHGFVTRDGDGRARTDAYQKGERAWDVGKDIFSRGLCLPSDGKMTAGEQEKVIEIVKRCFR